MYLSLTLDPANVDANVSPTKSEVHILHEEAVMQWLQEQLLALLSKAMAERALLDASSASQAPAPRTQTVAQLPQHLVRTDSSVNTITSYLSRQNSDMPPAASPAAAAPTPAKRRRVFRPPMLVSVEQLLVRVDREAEAGWEQRLAEHVLVGRLDHLRALLQFGTSLSLVNLAAISEEYFYQITLRNFGHHGALTIAPEPAAVLPLFMLALQVRGIAKEKREPLAKEGLATLLGWREMLDDYFKITIDADGRLVALPLLLENWVPDWQGLPEFLLKLASLDFTKEIRVFESVAVLLGHLYRYTSRQPADYGTLLLLPAVREGLALPRRLLEEGGVAQLTSVEQLYKVFERC